MNAFGKFAADLERAAQRLPAMRDRRLRKVAEGAAQAARSVAPVETGKLRAGISVRDLGDGVMAVEAEASDHGSYYAHFQEYGTSKMAPNPYLAPAVDKWTPRLFEAVEGLADDIGKEL